MTILDAFAVVAFLRDEPARDDVEQLLRSDQICRVSVVNLAETVDVLGRSGGFDWPTIQEQLSLLEIGGVIFEPADAPSAKLVGTLRTTHYQRKDCAISVADCFALALATTTGERLATADGALLSVAVQVGIGVVPLPDSTGRRP